MVSGIEIVIINVLIFEIKCVVLIQMGPWGIAWPYSMWIEFSSRFSRELTSLLMNCFWKAENTLNCFSLPTVTSVKFISTRVHKINRGETRRYPATSRLSLPPAVGAYAPRYWPWVLARTGARCNREITYVREQLQYIMCHAFSSSNNM